MKKVFLKSFSITVFRVLTDLQNDPENKDFVIFGGSVDNFGMRHKKVTIHFRFVQWSK